MNWIGWAAVIVGCAVLVFGLDRLFLWMEAKGWVYYRKRKSNGANMGNVFMGNLFMDLHEMVEPEVRSMRLVDQDQQRSTHASDEPPEDGDCGSSSDLETERHAE